jgi:Fe-S-cluster containining protein
MAPGTSTFNFDIGTPEGTIRASITVPGPMIRLSDLARAVMPLDEQLVKVSAKRHLTLTKTEISCKKGCGSCCNQLVPVSIPEAFLLHDLVSAMPEARQEVVLTRFIEAEEVHDEQGIDETTLNSVSNEDELREVLVAHHRLGVPCPFLEEGSCSIYRERPSMCREYLVTSPAENCAKVGETSVKPVPMSIRMSLALARVASRVLGGGPLIMPFTLAIRYGEAHEDEGQRRFDGYMLVNLLLEELAGKTATPS